MNISFNFEDAMFSIEEEIARIPQSLKGNSKQFINNASKIVKKNIEDELSKLGKSEAISNYDGTEPYIHMKNDVKTSVKDDKEGTVYAIIRGGKYTGYKWHLVNNGTIRSKATHFIEKALQKSESEIDSMAEKMIAEAVNNG